MMLLVYKMPCLACQRGLVEAHQDSETEALIVRSQPSPTNLVPMVTQLCQRMLMMTLSPDPEHILVTTDCSTYSQQT